MASATSLRCSGPGGRNPSSPGSSPPMLPRERKLRPKAGRIAGTKLETADTAKGRPVYLPVLGAGRYSATVLARQGSAIDVVVGWPILARRNCFRRVMLASLLPTLASAWRTALAL